MVAVRSLLRRVKRIEAGRDSPLLAQFGTPEFEAEIRADVAAKKLDRIDWLGEDGNGGVLAALKRWAQDGIGVR